MSTTSEAIRPPEPPGALTWLKENLFSNWFDALLTLLSLGIVIWVLSASIRWVFFTAEWTPVLRNPLLFTIGQYPRAYLWRIEVILAVIALLFGVSWRIWGGVMRTFAVTFGVFLLLFALWPIQVDSLPLTLRLVLGANLLGIGAGYVLGGLKFLRSSYVVAAWVVSLLLALVLLRGFQDSALLPAAALNLWGGLLVTLILAVGGIVLSFPIGVLLALGRRSSLPVVSLFSTVFIEVVRGVPLISILFLSSIILPLFLPQNIRIDLITRALIGMTFFSAAYMAENVRGGLAAVPGGQVEAAKAVGLNNFQITTLIVLPQALRAVIPPIVGQFISLFKDTTLASGVSVLEFLAIGRSILQANPEYFGMQTEVYLFIAAVFWIFSYLMSYASLRLEVALGVGER